MIHDLPCPPRSYHSLQEGAYHHPYEAVKRFGPPVDGGGHVCVLKSRPEHPNSAYDKKIKLSVPRKLFEKKSTVPITYANISMVVGKRSPEKQSAQVELKGGDLVQASTKKLSVKKTKATKEINNPGEESLQAKAPRKYKKRCTKEGEETATVLPTPHHLDQTANDLKSDDAKNEEGSKVNISGASESAEKKLKKQTQESKESKPGILRLYRIFCNFNFNCFSYLLIQSMRPMKF